MDELNAGFIPNEDETHGFVIDNDEAAEWALQKILEARRERDRLDALVDAQMERLTKRRREIDASCDAKTEGLQIKLEEYFRTVKPRRTKTTATYQLLSGRLVAKRGGWDYEKKDDTLCAWLAASGRDDMVQRKTVTTPKWGELKKLTEVIDGAVVIKDTGEVIDGVTAVRKPDTFSVIGMEE